MSRETEVLLKSSELIEDDNYGNRKLRTFSEDLTTVSGEKVLLIHNVKMQNTLDEILKEMRITNRYLAEFLGDSFKEHEK